MENSNDFCSCSELKTNSAVLVVRENGVWVGPGAEPPLKEPENSVAWEALGAHGKACRLPAKLPGGASVRETGSVSLCGWF